VIVTLVPVSGNTPMTDCDETLCYLSHGSPPERDVMNTARRNARGEVTLQRILDATVQLVGRYGYDNTTISRITKATQRPASSIYWYFEDKDDLIVTALENSYTRFPRDGRRPWQRFDPSTPLQSQLFEELAPELQASESETPLRLGITLALEGSAARSKVQEPFRRRRAAALAAIEKWWNDAFTAAKADDERRHGGVWWMSTLTLAFLDGHYISDVVVDDPEIVSARSRAVAAFLTFAFEALCRGNASLEVPGEDGADTPDGATEHENGPSALLDVTRRLVAQHGYEGATIGRICTESGMQRSSVYWRYKDKDTLIKAAVADAFLELLIPLHDLPTPSEDWVADLASAIGATMRAAGDNPDTVKAGLLLEVQQWDPPTAGGTAVVEGSAAAEAAVAEWFSTVCVAADAVEHLAWLVLRLIEGLMLGSVLGRPVPVDNLIRLLGMMVENGPPREALP
jgi:AcrR family transcriptional regulator